MAHDAFNCSHCHCSRASQAHLDVTKLNILDPFPFLQLRYTTDLDLNRGIYFCPDTAAYLTFFTSKPHRIPTASNQDVCCRRRWQGQAQPRPLGWQVYLWYYHGVSLTSADDKDKQLLLCLQFACVKGGIRIPCKFHTFTAVLAKIPTLLKGKRSPARWDPSSQPAPASST
jgi:hypothetical protein